MSGPNPAPSNRSEAPAGRLHFYVWIVVVEMLTLLALYAFGRHFS